MSPHRRKHLSAYLSEPPRPVPATVRIRLLFGGFPGLFGWLWVAITVAILPLMLSRLDVPRLASGTPEVVEGTVTGVERTSATINERHVQRYDFRFVAGDGVERTGSSYAYAGRLPAPGETVRIEYPRGEPAAARIAGMQRRQLPFLPFVVFALFPLIGVPFVAVAFARGAIAGRLLRVGRLAAGKLERREATRVTMNRRPVVKLTCSFTAPDGTQQTVVARTHQPERVAAETDVIYDPANPRRAVVMAALPGRPQIDADGSFAPGNAVLAALLLLLPLGGIAAMVIAWYLLR